MIHSVPLDIKNCIVYSVNPYKKNKKEIDICLDVIANLFLANKQLGKDTKHSCKKQFSYLVSLKRDITQQLEELRKKYPAYQAVWTSFLAGVRRNDVLEKGKLEGGLALLDALASGCPFTQTLKTFEDYTASTQKDIEKLLMLCPESVSCTGGFLSPNRPNMAPLVIACFNKKIPVEVIELLLRNGADPNIGYWVVSSNGVPCASNILVDLKKNQIDRFNEVKEVFKKYNAHPFLL